MSLDLNQHKESIIYFLATYIALDIESENVVDYSEDLNSELKTVVKVHEKINDIFSAIRDLLLKWPDFVIEGLITSNLYITESNKEYKLFIDCNDLFCWAFSDAEELLEEDFEKYKQALEMSKKYGHLLFICRKRNMRPQKAYYKLFNDSEKLFFDQAGPPREV